MICMGLLFLCYSVFIWLSSPDYFVSALLSRNEVMIYVTIDISRACAAGRVCSLVLTRDPRGIPSLRSSAAAEWLGCFTVVDSVMVYCELCIVIFSCVFRNWMDWKCLGYLCVLFGLVYEIHGTLLLDYFWITVGIFGLKCFLWKDMPLHSSPAFGAFRRLCRTNDNQVS